MANLVNKQSLIRVRCEVKKIWNLEDYGIEIYATEEAFLNISLVSHTSMPLQPNFVFFFYMQSLK